MKFDSSKRTGLIILLVSLFSIVLSGSNVTPTGPVVSSTMVRLVIKGGNYLDCAIDAYGDQENCPIDCSEPGYPCYQEYQTTVYQHDTYPTRTILFLGGLGMLFVGLMLLGVFSIQVRRFSFRKNRTCRIRTF